MTNDLLENAKQNLAIAQRYGSFKETAKWLKIIKKLEQGPDGIGPQPVMYTNIRNK